MNIITKSELTNRRQFIFHLQHDSLAYVFQQTNNLIVTELGQVDAVDRLDVVPNVQLVTPSTERREAERKGK